MGLWQGLGLVFVFFSLLFIAVGLSGWVWSVAHEGRWAWLKIPGLIVFLLLLGAFLSSCSGTSDAPLTIISPDTPIGPMVPDHLDYSEAP